MNNLSQRINTVPVPHNAELAEICLSDLKTDLAEKEWANEFLLDLDNSSQLKALLLGVFGNSPYLTSLIKRRPEDLIGALYNPPETRMSELGAELKENMKSASSMDEAMRHLRGYKKKAALFTALTDLSSCWDVPKVIEAITISADTALEQTTEFLFRQAMIKGDVLPKITDKPAGDSGYIILAMGKQGAFELNYSSDVDLIVFYDLERKTLKEGIEPSTFFVKLTRNMVKMMQELTADGYVYRVDLRLRPDPGATQIALSTDAAYSYYESFGQNWERAAMIKARPVAGDIEAGEELLKGLAPFVWRKYLDFAAIDDIHAMKRQVNAVKGHSTIAITGHNIKLGRGGIREIEFFTQTQQLIAGGRQAHLRTTKTLETLKGLTEEQWIAPKARDELTIAYNFLRLVEHRIQMVNDEQTHTLPKSEEGMTRIANFSGFQTLEEFSKKLRHELETVQHHYAELFEDDKSLASECGNLVFVGDDIDPNTRETVEKLGFKDPVKAIETVKAWHYGRYASTRSERARERLTEFQPKLLEALSNTEQPDGALSVFDKFLGELPAGVQLFSLLSSNPKLLNLIAEIMGTAPGLARVLSRRSKILDAVLAPEFFGDLPDHDVLSAIIEDKFSSCKDYQDTLDLARVIGQEQSFLIGVRLLSGIISADVAAFAYSRLAETIIQKLLEKVEEEMSHAHGGFEGASVTVLAMGKLGGYEMTASSDLDLILIYDFNQDQVQSDGKKPLSPTQYYSRITQRLISALSAPTAEGELYEVDMRLRPSGRSGPVATQLNSFIDYQKNKAWVWEHLALTRARCLTGSPSLKEKLNETIKIVISKDREKATLITEVRDMRERIAKEKGTENIWNIKQVRGGQVDIEFICQYLQLQFSHIHPDIIDTNTVSSLEKIVESNLLDGQDGNLLVEASHLYNDLIQVIRLSTEKGFIPETASMGLKLRLAKTANLETYDELVEKLKNSQNQVKLIFDKIFN
ncbi:MAG: bifunctional [glutamine synthetase] adenylyltransferase/[glutamine synthetase]-adenylyl-L-tyrosine phosphorylase [Rhodomicrobiaceae bacterium]